MRRNNLHGFALTIEQEEASMTTRDHDRKFISILMESPLYMTLSLKERQSLLARLAESYPLLDGKQEEGSDEEKSE